MNGDAMVIAGFFTLGVSIAFSAPDVFRRPEPGASARQQLALLIGLTTKLSPASIALGYSLQAIGVAAIAAGRLIPEPYAPVLDVLMQAVGIGLLLEYVVRVSRQSQATASLRWSFIGLRLGQAIVVAHLVLAFFSDTGADVILLLGMVHHMITDGERGQFLGQFLAPQVAQLVRLQGIDAITTQKPMEVSIVCCDLRGYTAMTESAGAARVLELLGNYYDTVGAAVAEAGGTIKDQAGDGILILVGAPLPVADHAARALALARKLRAVGVQLRRDWEPRGLRPGLGVGVATGEIVAGAIGRATRLEYTAVGEPVNLAARLCSQAADGEVLADPRTIAAAGSSAGSFETRAPMSLKGISKPVAAAALVDAA